MNEIQYQVYDFASSARVHRPLWLAFNHWMQKFAELFVEHWANFSSTGIQAIPLPIDAHEFQAIQDTWAKPAYAVCVNFKQNATSGMLVFDRIELLTLLMDILGNADDEVVDRELTPVESSLCELVFAQAASTIDEGWPQQEPLTFEIGELIDQPNRSRIFAPGKKMLTSGLDIQLPNTSITLVLVLAKDETAKLLGVEENTSKKLNANNRMSHDKIAEIDVQVVAGIGQAELPMQDLVSISVGDIILLDQQIEDPLIVFANDEPVFHAWPGRVDNQQVLKIVSPFN